MGNKWIIDVLADLQSFARDNGLALLADQLEQTANVATAEFAEVSKGAATVHHYDKKQTGQLSTGT